jgi:hypothetical protein
VALKYLDTCPGDLSGRWEATLQSGTVVKGRDSTWPFNVKDQRMPVNRRVTQLAATGAGMVVKDNTATINSVMSGGPAPVGGAGSPGAGGSSGQSSGSGGGCSFGGGTAGGTLGLLLVGMFVLLNRRRRR